MSVRAIHGDRPVYSASNAADALGRALHEIRQQDGLTWADVGAVLGVSEDQAAKYANGMATMSFVTYGRGKREWNGRFCGYFERLCVDSRAGSQCDHLALTNVLSAATSLSQSLADGEITAAEIRESRQLLEQARDDLDALLSKARAVA
ncbi:hypothetical protein CMI47_05395 [Candidatus Pacearchaeota archaeon]|jgi:transcriptional regulator with XRE-family HTH domain|nr:hypothetical protein [Candidatus Pacearchaeota archaeon]